MKHILLAAICCGLFLSGCGKAAPNPDRNHIYSATELMESEMAAGPHWQDMPETEIPAETKDVTADMPYLSLTTEFEITGFQKYDSIRGETGKDTPADGNCYLVIFLSIKNLSMENVYIHPDQINASIDGTEVDNTFLLNDPEGYRSVLDTISPGDTRQGYVVFEAPSDWKHLELCFL
ncbi:MAG: DUF4352 domain-containing protein [Ruminococcus flavefaciens]|nr:DUF4352 domain-containing protein [Ruminococcus flavefaciens]